MLHRVPTAGEYPANPPPGFNPHGIAADFARRRLVAGKPSCCSCRPCPCRHGACQGPARALPVCPLAACTAAELWTTRTPLSFQMPSVASVQACAGPLYVFWSCMRASPVKLECSSHNACFPSCPPCRLLTTIPLCPHPLLPSSPPLCCHGPHPSPQRTTSCPPPRYPPALPPSSAQPSTCSTWTTGPSSKPSMQVSVGVCFGWHRLEMETVSAFATRA